MAWIMSNAFLSQSQMENNALEFANYFIGRKGWTMQAVAGMLGNIESESTINPGIWEGLDAGNLNVGFGLVQWTPASKYINWAGSNWYNAQRECERIVWETENDEQWFANPEAGVIGLPVNPPFSFSTFTQSAQSPDYLARCFLAYYEHPGDINQPNRGTQATAWYQFLSGHHFHGQPPIGALVKRGCANGYLRRQRIYRNR